MKDPDYDKSLLDTLKTKLPVGINPVWFIMDALSIGKEAAYRRLRGEVPLLLQEAVLLSKALGISLNELADTGGDTVHYYNLSLVDFEIPEETDYISLRVLLDNIGQAGGDPLSQLGVTANMFPLQLFLRYKALTRFALFKWLYLTGRRQAKAYQQVKIADRMQQVLSDLREAYLQFSTTCYIFDRQLSRSLVSDLRYFTSVGLLSTQEAESIRGEARGLLNYMEQLAQTGKYENGKTVQMYVSDIHFSKSYYNIKAGGYYAGIIEICVLNGLVSTGENCYRRMNDWLDSRRRLSTLISQSSEPRRVTFFKEQHLQLDEL